MSVQYNYFLNRWQLTTESISDNQLEINKLRQQLIHQEQVIVYLLTKLIDNETLSINDEAIKQFLHLPQGEEKEVLTRLKSKAGTILGKVRCPTCDALVEDVEGVFEEKCAWCGSTVETDK